MLWTGDLILPKEVRNKTPQWRRLEQNLKRKGRSFPENKGGLGVGDTDPTLLRLPCLGLSDRVSGPDLPGGKITNAAQPRVGCGSGRGQKGQGSR